MVTTLMWSSKTPDYFTVFVAKTKKLHFPLEL